MSEEWINRLYSLVLQQMKDGIILSDADGTSVFVNEAAERIRNVKREDILGKYMLD